MRKSFSRVIVCGLCLSLFTACLPHRHGSRTDSSLGTTRDNFFQQTIHGTLDRLPPMSLLPTAIAEIYLWNASTTNSSPVIVASTRIEHPASDGAIKFDISLDPALYNFRHDYYLTAHILLESNVLFTTDTEYPVFVNRDAGIVKMTLVRPLLAEDDPKRPRLPIVHE